MEKIAKCVSANLKNVRAKMNRILLVSGARDFTSASILFSSLSTLHARFTFTHLYHGDARGVDKLCGVWGKGNGLEVRPFPYLHQYGRAGGVLRNQQMLDAVKGEWAVLAAFPTPESIGTRDMINRCVEYLPVFVYEVANDPPRVLFIKSLVPKSWVDKLDEK